jgi:hypothetical protein
MVDLTQLDLGVYVLVERTLAEVRNLTLAEDSTGDDTEAITFVTDADASYQVSLEFVNQFVGSREAVGRHVLEYVQQVLRADIETLEWRPNAGLAVPTGDAVATPEQIWRLCDPRCSDDEQLELYVLRYPFEILAEGQS